MKPFANRAVRRREAAKVGRFRRQSGFVLDTALIAAGTRLDRRRRLAAMIEDRRASSRNAAARLMNAENLLQSGVPGGVAVVDHVEIDLRDALRKGETVLAAIDRNRLGIREIGAERHRIESAQQTLAEGLAQAQAEIDAVAKRGEIDASALLEARLPLAWPTTTQRLQLAAVVGATGGQVIGHAMGEITDVHALTVWLLKDILTQKVTEQLTSMADPANALSAADREQQLADLDEQALALERREVALVRKARAEGHVVDFRVDTDVRALLGVEFKVVDIAQPADKPWGRAAAAAAAAGVIEVR